MPPPLERNNAIAYRLKNSPEHQIRFQELQAVAETYGVQTAIADINTWFQKIARNGVGTSVNFYRTPADYKRITEQAFFGGPAPTMWNGFTASTNAPQPEELRSSAISPDAIAASRGNDSRTRG